MSVRNGGKKRRLLESRVHYLGYVVEDGEITPSEEKTNAVRHFPKPTNVRAVQAFLGLTADISKNSYPDIHM